MQPKKKVLAVDDNPINLEIIKEALEEDYDIRTATTGREALEIAVDFQPDVILLDVMMPGMDGYEVCRQLRGDSTFQDTPIIMVTAKGMVEEKVAGREAGADDYIVKPFKEEDLRESIEFFLCDRISAENSQ